MNILELRLSSSKSRLQSKQQELVQLMRNQLCYKRMLKRNEKRDDKLKVKLPFFIV